MFSVGQLSRAFRLSRSTLLYYDSIGLLTPSGRSGANYRQYSDQDSERLRRICLLREVGVPLERIRTLLDQCGPCEITVLEQRLQELNQEIRCLRLKQQLIVAMLQSRGIGRSALLPDKMAFVAVLEAVGVTEQVMHEFHQQFEDRRPEFHQAFLEFLGMNDAEIGKIRKTNL